MFFEYFIQFSKISPLLAAISNFIIGFIVFRANPKNSKNRVFSAFAIVLTNWALYCFFQSITKDYSIALHADFALYITAAFAPVMFLHTINTFTSKNRNRELVVGYTLGIIISFLNFTPIFRKGVQLLFQNRFITIPNIGWYLFLAYYVVVVLFALKDLLNEYNRSNGMRKKTLLNVFISYLFLIAAGNSYFLLILGINVPPLDSILNLLSSFTVVIYTSMMAYIITRYRFMDIRLAIRKLTHVLGLLIIFGVPVLLLNHFAGGHYLAPAYALITVLLYPMMNMNLARLTDRIFSGELRYLNELDTLALRVFNFVTFNEIVRVVCETLKTNMGLANCRLLGIWEITGTPLAEILKSEQEEINIEDLKAIPTDKRTELNATIIEYMSREAIELALPVLYDGSLMAVLLLGTKKNNELFSAEDTDRLYLLCRQIGAAISKAHWMEEQMKGQREVERLAMAAVMSDFIHDSRNRLQPMTAAPSMVLRILYDSGYQDEHQEQFTKIKDYMLRVVSSADNLVKIYNNVKSYLGVLEEDSKEFALIDSLHKVIDQVSLDHPGIVFIKTFAGESVTVTGRQRFLELAVSLVCGFLIRLPERNIKQIRVSVKIDLETRKVEIELSSTGKQFTDQELKETLDIYKDGHVMEMTLARKILQRHSGNLLFDNINGDIQVVCSFDIISRSNV